MAKIIVLEDDAPTRRLICAVVSKIGHEALDFDNGAEGLLNVMAEQPDLVISDIQMPKMNGFEVLAQIRMTLDISETPVILLTALSEQADVQRGIDQGANDYITKPFEPAALARSIQAQLQNAAKQRLQSSSRAPLSTTQATTDFSPSRASSALLGYRSSVFSDRDEEPLSGFANTSAGELLSSLSDFDAFPSIDDPVFAPKERAEPLAPPPTPSWPTTHIPKAWAVHISILSSQQLQESLPIKAWRSLLRQLFLPVSKDAALKDADYLNLDDSRLTLYFVDRGDGRGAVTAAQAVQALLRSSIECRQWASDVFRGLGVPAPRIGIDLHCGPIEVVRKPLDFGGERDFVQGQTSELIERLREGEPRVMWRVLATRQALKSSGSIYKLGASMELSVGTQDVVVYALQGIAQTQTKPTDTNEAQQVSAEADTTWGITELVGDKYWI